MKNKSMRTITMKKLIIAALLISNSAFADRYILKFDSELTDTQLSQLEKNHTIDSVEHFHTKAPFNKYYIANTNKKLELIHPNLVYSKLEGEVESLSIIPSSDATTNTNILFNYQWYLEANNQVILNDIDDINAETVKATEAYDINYNNIVSAESDEEVIVAVIDHGVDIEHPDLKNMIYKNKAECSRFGKVRFKAEDDLDGNGYIGDCNGMDFSEDLEKGNPVVKDKNGHGTHVAGIIAAENNATGVAGLAPNAKILPIKVFATKKSGDDKPTKSITVIDRIAKAMIYAADSNAKVINLSLGWPRSLDNELIRDAVKYAQDKGSIIVAASGNNSNNATISPCNYHGVICVGASRADGKWANFSNYGGNVDIVAPGEQIISTHPQTITSKIFSLNGYEIKNGTSQASPMVAAYIAYLAGKHPQATNTELISHIYSSSVNITNDDKFSAFGLMQVTDAKTKLQANVFRPIFKQQEMILIKDGKFTLPIDIQSYSALDNKVEITIKSLTDNITLSSTQFNKKIENFGSAEIIIEGELISEMKDNISMIEIEIKSTNFTRKFTNRLTLINDTLSRAKSFNIASDIDPRRILTINDPLELFNTPTYSLLNYDKESKDLTISILSKNDSSIDIGASRTFTNTLKLISFAKLDSNYDSQEDYILKLLNTVDEQRIIKVFYLDKDLNSLYSEFEFIKYNPEGAIGKKVNYLPKIINGKKIATETFVEMGVIPQAQLDLNPFVARPNDKTLRIYTLTPVKVNDTWELQTVMVSDEEFESNLKSDYTELAYLYYLNMKPMNKSEFYAGKFNILTFIDGLSAKDLKNLAIDSNLDSELSGKLPYRQNPNTFYKTTFNITKSPSRNEELHAIYAQNGYKINIYTLAGDKVRYTGKNKRDSVIGHIATYIDTEATKMFIQTKSKIKLVKRNTVMERPVTRFSFLPGTLLTDLFYPIALNKNGELRPAIYVDGTSISTNHISIITEEDNKLISPVKYSVHVPRSCRTLNPVFNKDANTFKYVLLCKKDGESKMMEVILAD